MKTSTGCPLHLFTACYNFITSILYIKVQPINSVKLHGRKIRNLKMKLCEENYTRNNDPKAPCYSNQAKSVTKSFNPDIGKHKKTNNINPWDIRMKALLISENLPWTYYHWTRKTALLIASPMSVRNRTQISWCYNLLLNIKHKLLTHPTLQNINDTVKIQVKRGIELTHKCLQSQYRFNRCFKSTVWVRLPIILCAEFHFQLLKMSQKHTVNSVPVSF